jgi:methylmalonyl-CoA mutase cobalamin-binding subunit
LIETVAPGGTEAIERVPTKTRRLLVIGPGSGLDGWDRGATVVAFGRDGGFAVSSTSLVTGLTVESAGTLASTADAD